MSNLGLSGSLLQLKNLLKRDPDTYSEEVSYCIKVNFLTIFGDFDYCYLYICC